MCGGTQGHGVTQEDGMERGHEEMLVDMGEHGGAGGCGNTQGDMGTWGETWRMTEHKGIWVGCRGCRGEVGGKQDAGVAGETWVGNGMQGDTGT